MTGSNIGLDCPAAAGGRAVKQGRIRQGRHMRGAVVKGTTVTTRAHRCKIATT